MTNLLRDYLKNSLKSFCDSVDLWRKFWTDSLKNLSLAKHLFFTSKKIYIIISLSFLWRSGFGWVEKLREKICHIVWVVMGEDPKKKKQIVLYFIGYFEIFIILRFKILFVLYMVSFKCKVPSDIATIFIFLKTSKPLAIGGGCFFVDGL